VVRTTLGAEVETTVNVSGSEDVDFINADISAPISAGNNVIRTVRPPTGALYELISLRLEAANPGGSSGDSHDITLRTELQGITTLVGVASGDQRLRFNGSFFQDADSVQRPPTPAAQITAIKGSRASETAGFDLRYRNKTAVTQTTDVKIRLWVREITVGDT